MKLYEYSVMIEVGFVIAAESKELAQRRVKGWSAEGIARCGDISPSVSMDLLYERELKSDDPSDEAHDVVAPQQSVEAGEQQPTPAGVPFVGVW